MVADPDETEIFTENTSLAGTATIDVSQKAAVKGDEIIEYGMLDKTC